MYDHHLVIVKNSDSSDEYYLKALDEFPNKRICEGAAYALQELGRSPADVVIAEMDLDEMSGIELAEAIRDIDADRSRFTYIILVADDMSEEIQRAFARSVDAWAHMGDDILVSLAIAGARVAEHVGELAAARNALLEEREQLQKGQLLDPLTGLGNRQFLEQTLQTCVRQIESRGGAVCFILISVDNYEETLNRFDKTIADQLIIEVAEQLRHLVRPLDTTSYFGSGQFAMVLLQPSIKQCVASSYQRIYDRVRHKSYTTAAGYLPVRLAMSICGTEADTGAPAPDAIIRTAQENLVKSRNTQQIVVVHMTPE